MSLQTAPQGISRLPNPLKVALVAVCALGTIELFVLAGQFNVAKIDQGLATLCGTIVGLGIIAYQTNQGFANLIKSQENQSRIERDARLHTAELRAAEKAANLIHEKQKLLSALRAEIASLHSAVYDFAAGMRNFILLYRALHKQGTPSTIKKLTFGSFDAPIYRANISSLGLLGTSLGADIIKVLGKANGKLFISDESPTPFPLDMVAKLYEGQADSYVKWCSDLFQVAMRIRAVEEGTPDPGTLVETQAKRYAELTLSENDLSA
jgi:hypothetical protein